MKALVLEKQGQLSLRDIAIDETLGPDDVRIAMHTVGICGSDVHYYQHGRIGPFVVREPMVLGHEASGTVVEVGDNVTTLAVGDRVCMAPGIPDPDSRASRMGMYNLNPAVRFWATPPVHGCLRAPVMPSRQVRPAATCDYSAAAASDRSADGYVHAAGSADRTDGEQLQQFVQAAVQTSSTRPNRNRHGAKCASAAARRAMTVLSGHSSPTSFCKP